MKKILAIFGTRPCAIKMIPLIRELKKNDKFETYVCSTWQHREMLDSVLEAFDMKPDFNLDVMKEKQTLSTLTSTIITKLDPLLKDLKPDLVLVHWDTTTWFTSSLVAFYNQIPVWHVEAWLRTFDKWSPFPEEVNRQLISKIASINFSPTENNKNNLLNEWINWDSIYVTGNTAIDAMKITVKNDYKFNNELLNTIDFDNKRLILVTAHRRENIWENLKNICEAIKETINKYADVIAVFPVHLNPVVRETVYQVLWGVDRCYLTEPLDVFDLHNLINKSYLVATDSWWLQEEAPFLWKPVLVLRTETERPEAVEAWTVKIVWVNKDNIIKNIEILLNNRQEYDEMAKAVNPYWDGTASEKIISSIEDYFNI